jgi:predicted aspartyl protease
MHACLPLVHIRLKHGDLAFRTDALIDSGATATFLPIEIAEVLGMDLSEKPSEAVGAGALSVRTTLR